MEGMMLLNEEYSEQGIPKTSYYETCKHRTCRHTWISASLFTLLLINIAVLAVNVQERYASRCSDILEAREISPANSAIQYEWQQMDFHSDKSPYAGSPRPEFDDAWRRLLNFTTIEVTEAELRVAGKTSMLAATGENYLALLSVYHQLHCIKQMVQIRHPDYYPDITFSEKHFNHCVEVLRQGVMCHADTRVNTFKWDEKGFKNYSVVTDGQRKCVNWERFETWARSRYPKTFAIAVGNGMGIKGPADQPP